MNVQPRQRILIIEDDRINRTVLAALLKDEHQVILAKNGEQALERLAIDAEIDLILLDVMMPDMDGYEVLRRIKADDSTKNIPVVFITALNSTVNEEEGLKLGASDYIGKPFSPAIVKARISNLLRFVRQRKMLETLAGHDGLTEIPNRRTFDQILAQEIGRSQRSGQPFGLAMLDIDYFKQYNDHYGHAAGDEALKAVAKAIALALQRPADLAARYGGEEFALILPDTDLAGCIEVAEAVQAAINTLQIEHAASPVARHVTISLGGITSSSAEDDADELIRRADHHLYAAKRAGRNQISWCDATSAAPAVAANPAAASGSLAAELDR